MNNEFQHNENENEDESDLDITNWLSQFLLNLGLASFFLEYWLLCDERAR